VILAIILPDDLSGYETEPGDLVQATLGTVETWVGPDYEAFLAARADLAQSEPVRYKA
jgi:hypothetical protein